MNVDIEVIFKAKFFSHSFNCFGAEVVTKVGEANIITSNERVESAWTFLNFDDVMKLDRNHDGFEIVVAVFSFVENLKREIDLRVGFDYLMGFLK